jgi:N4-(beta-N-acetylglucosaminyl)-L-asparaginase
MTTIDRRTFIGGAALAAGAFAAGSGGAVQARPANRPVIVSSANGLRATARASEILLAGGRPIDAVVAGVNIIEDDPADDSVGYGGLPNEEGVVELDASVMDGATGGAGAVAGLHGIKNPSKVAQLVMERTDHVLLVGQGAQRFALAHGFKIEDLLTDESRRIWLTWRETHSQVDDWGPSEFQAEPGTSPPSMAPKARLAPSLDPFTARARWCAAHPPTGTISCLALDAAGNLAGVTTTSGLAFKIPGRVGDSPLIGCGLYVDNEVGAAGSTGRGEEVIKINGARIVVENMRRGMPPRDACLDALQRIVDRYKSRGRPAWQVNFYAVNKDGAHAGAAIWDMTGNHEGPKRAQYAVFDGTTNALHDSAHLFKRAWK